jgi:hypothetical protein
MKADAARGAAWNKFYSRKPTTRAPGCAYLAPLTFSMEAFTMAQHSRAIALAVLCLLGSQAHAQTADHDTPRPLRMESVTIGERGTEVLVQFDRPISHERSSLFLVHNGKVIETIYPRLEASPKVLFARILTPTPGAYVLRWTVCPQGSNDRYDGEFPFTVGQVATSAGEPRQSRSRAE